MFSSRAKFTFTYPFHSPGLSLVPRRTSGYWPGVFRAAKSVPSHPHVMMVMINVVSVTAPLVLFLFRQSSYRFLRREILTSVVHPLKAVVCFALVRSSSEDCSFTALFECRLLRSYSYGTPNVGSMPLSRRVMFNDSESRAISCRFG